MKKMWMAMGLGVALLSFCTAGAKETDKPCEHRGSYLLQDDSYEATDTEGGYRHYVCQECQAEYSYETAPMVYETNPKTGEPVSLSLAANPYLPNFELMPDNELHVFWSREDEEWRVYATGSHDSYTTGTWCGDEAICWSAPVYDLTDWRYEGIMKDGGWYFACDFNYDLQTDQAIYYAFPFFGNPDMESYHLLTNGRSVPDSPFDQPLCEEGIEGIDFMVLNFDPAIYIEDDGTIYLVFDKQAAEDGSEPKHCQLTRLSADRRSIEWSVGVRMAEGEPSTDGFNPENYEANTLDYIPEYGVYVIQYSYVAEQAEVNGQGYYPLAYIYTTDTDLEHALWHWSGIIGDNGGFYVKNPKTGEIEKSEEASYSWDNNHGGLVKINGDWYLSNHRHTGVHACRQGYLEKVTMSFEDGRLTILPTEYTSSIGESLDGFHPWEAFRACYITPTQSYSSALEDGTPIAPVAYIDALKGEDSKDNGFVYDDPDYALHRTPIVGIQDGVVVGFKYLDFGAEQTDASLKLLVSREEGAVDGTVRVTLDVPGENGTLLAEVDISAAAVEEAPVVATGSDGTEWREVSVSCEQPLEGVHGVYFAFSSEEEGRICKFDEFAFEPASAQ